LRHLLNTSFYPFDLERNGGVEGIAALCRRLGLDGVELLTGHSPPSIDLRPLTQGVHLPYGVDWLAAWEGRPMPEGLEGDDILFFSFGRDREEAIRVIRRSWELAATLEPSYGIFHAGNPRLDGIFTQEFPYSDEEVLFSLAAMLNQVVEGFPDGEPPFTIMLENLWWPGLRFLDGEEHRTLSELLDFENWGYCLDTGHLMNSLRDCREEEQAIVRTLSHLEGLPSEMIERVGVVHLHLSLSAQYQEESISRGDPEGFREMSHRERINLAFPHFSAIDWHAPFRSDACRDIVDLLSPSFVTHEFICAQPGDMEKKLSQQLAHFRDREPLSSPAARAAQSTIK